MTEDPLRDEKQLYELRLDAELKEIQARLELLRAQTRRAAVELRIQLERELNRLTVKKTALHYKLDELKAAGCAGWAKFQEALDSGRSELADGLEAIAAKLR